MLNRVDIFHLKAYTRLYAPFSLPLMLPLIIARRRIGIIGAGPAGIIALRTFLKPKSNYDVVVFEKTHRAGGIWNYDEYGGPMYQNLRTNLPMPVMRFLDFTKHDMSSSFPTHYEVLEYINNYLDSMNGRDYIQFNTTVKEVYPIVKEKNGEPPKWKVITSVKEAMSIRENSHEFDFVFVCNGHYDVPYMPSVPGLDNFQGTVIHSKDYFVPEQFANKKVIVLGARASGQDIVVDVASQASQVILSHRAKPLSSKLPANVSQTSSIVSYENGAFVTADGLRIEDVDVFLCCTGYQYEFPFLDRRCGVSVLDGRCHPVWKQIVNVEHPSMFFIGLPQAVAPNPMFALQCTLARAIIDGRTVLPSKQEMMDDIKAEYQRQVEVPKKIPKYLHVFADKQWEYNDDIAELAGCSKIPSYIGTMYVVSCGKRNTQLLSYRNFHYETMSDDEFIVTEIEKC